METDWFYIQHISSHKVVCINSNTEHEFMRSQVIVTEPKYTDEELWCWEDHRLKNKSTGLVLDIRKGKLRLIEDTDICLYSKKPDHVAQNQLWGIRQENEGKSTVHPLTYKRPPGSVIYSMCNSDWVLDVASDNKKLILFPYRGYVDESISQYWSLVSEADMNNTSFLEEMSEEDRLSCHSNSMSSVSTFDSVSSNEFAHGLRPAKRSSLQKMETNSSEYIQFQHFALA